MSNKNDENEMDFLVSSMIEKPSPGRGRPALSRQKETVNFYLDSENVAKIRTISRLTDVPISNIADYALKKFWKDYEKIHGEIPIDEYADKKKKSAADLLKK